MPRTRPATLLAVPAALAALVVLGACTDPEPVRPDTPWREGPALPSPRLEAAVAALGTRLVVAGGFSSSSGEITREVLALDTLAGTWSELPELPVAWTHASLAASAGTLYLLGGLDGLAYVARGEAFALDLGASDWRPLPPLPAGSERGAAAVIAAPPNIFLIGGSSTSGPLATVLAYNLTSSTWSELPPLPIARSHAAALRRSDGTLIVAGGLGPAGPLADAYALPLGATAWTPRAPMPAARGGCAYGPALGALVCAGGETGTSALRVVLAYDPIGDIWTTLPELPEPRAGAPGVVIGQQLYIPGGSASLSFQPMTSLVIGSLIDALSR